MAKNKSVICIASTHEQAERIVDQLKSAKFSNNDISVLFPDKSSSRDFAYEKKTKAPEGAITGVGAGGVLGGALGWVAGIGALAIPGVGPFIAAGPIVAALSGAAVGATVGGITGALIGLGIPELEAKRYEGKVKAGNILISVHTDNSDEIDQAKDIFTRAGAEDITTAGEEAVGRDRRARGRETRAGDRIRPLDVKHPTREEIAQRAYEIYVREGRPQGREQEHWREAEQQLSA
jgi:hypothetical protein